MVTKVTVTSKGLSGVIVSKCWSYCLTMLSIDGFELSDSSVAKRRMQESL